MNSFDQNVSVIETWLIDSYKLTNIATRCCTWQTSTLTNSTSPSRQVSTQIT